MDEVIINLLVDKLGEQGGLMEVRIAPQRATPSGHHLPLQGNRQAASQPGAASENSPSPAAPRGFVSRGSTPVAAALLSALSSQASKRNAQLQSWQPNGRNSSFSLLLLGSLDAALSRNNNRARANQEEKAEGKSASFLPASFPPGQVQAECGQLMLMGVSHPVRHQAAHAPWTTVTLALEITHLLQQQPTALQAKAQARLPTGGVTL